jgi:hypothetical protein
MRGRQAARPTIEFWRLGTGNAGSGVGSQEPGILQFRCTYIIIVVLRCSGLFSTWTLLPTFVLPSMPELPLVNKATRNGCPLAIRKLLAIRSPEGDLPREGAAAALPRPFGICTLQPNKKPFQCCLPNIPPPRCHLRQGAIVRRGGLLWWRSHQNEQ